ncbi:hypothetical protein SAMN05444166_5098 [Singulisphaera sp. GP187]|nr:hypothetical protein SAMN05444166_5098 [Singulisphaera sp. GP187]
MTWDLTKFARLLLFVSLATLITPTWSQAQGPPTDPRGLYGAYEPFARLPTPPKEGEFRRRIPESTKSRFAPHFRSYMGESGTEDILNRPAGVRGRAGVKSPVNFANDDDDENDNKNDKGFQSAQVTSRFGEKERETRRDAYREYLKERDPAKRAQLYREYIGKNAYSQSSGDRSATHDLSNPSLPSVLTSPPGFGRDRGGSSTRPFLSSSPSSSPAVPRTSLFSSSQPKAQTSPGLFRRSDGPATQKSTGSASRRLPSRATGSAGQSFKNDDDR